MNTARGVILKGLVEVAARVSGFITFPIMVRYIGAGGYGAYGQLNTIVGFIIPFASLGLGGVMVRFFADREWTFGLKKRLLQIILLVFLLSGMASLLMVIGAPILNKLFLNWEKGALLFRWGAFLVSLGGVEQLLFNFFRSRQWIIQYSLFQLIQTLITMLTVIILFPAGYDLVRFIQAVILIKVGLIFVLMLGFWMWNRPVSSITHVDNIVSFSRLIRFGLPVAVAGLGLWMMNLGDRLIIGHFMASTHLGLYAAAYMFALLLVPVNSPLLLPMYPRLMKVISLGNMEEIKKVIRLFHRYTTIVLVPAAIFLIVIIKPLLLVMGGTDFRVDYILISMIVGAIFIDQWNGVAQYTLICYDKVLYSQNVWLIFGLLNVGANYFVVPLFGLKGAAFITLISFLISNVIFFLLAKSFLPLSTWYRFDVMWKAIISSLFAVGINIILFGGIHPMIISLVRFTGIFFVTYFFMMIVLREVGKDDLLRVADAFYIKTKK